MFFAAFERKWWKTPGKDGSGKEVSGEKDSGQIMKDEPADTRLPPGERFQRINEDNFMANNDNDDSISRVAATLEDVKLGEELWDEVDHAGKNIIHIDEDGVAKDESEISASDSDWDEDSEPDDDVFTNIAAGDEPEDLSLDGPAYDLDGQLIVQKGDRSEFDQSEFEPLDDARPSARADIGSAREFFSDELPLRFDLLKEQEKEELVGRYRVEVRGQDGGVWTIALDAANLSVVPAKEDADLVLMVHHDDLMAVVNGVINPQIALASQRIKISGNPRKASLLQNVLAPRFD